MITHNTAKTVGLQAINARNICFTPAANQTEDAKITMHRYRYLHGSRTTLVDNKQKKEINQVEQNIQQQAFMEITENKQGCQTMNLVDQQTL